MNPKRVPFTVLATMTFLVFAFNSTPSDTAIPDPANPGRNLDGTVDGYNALGVVVDDPLGGPRRRLSAGRRVARRVSRTLCRH